MGNCTFARSIPTCACEVVGLDRDTRNVKRRVWSESVRHSARHTCPGGTMGYHTERKPLRSLQIARLKIKTQNDNKCQQMSSQRNRNAKDSVRACKRQRACVQKTTSVNAKDNERACKRRRVCVQKTMRVRAKQRTCVQRKQRTCGEPSASMNTKTPHG